MLRRVVVENARRFSSYIAASRWNIRKCWTPTMRCAPKARCRPPMPTCCWHHQGPAVDRLVHSAAFISRNGQVLTEAAIMRQARRAARGSKEKSSSAGLSRWHWHFHQARKAGGSHGRDRSVVRSRCRRCRRTGRRADGERRCRAIWRRRRPARDATSRRFSRLSGVLPPLLSGLPPHFMPGSPGQSAGRQMRGPWLARAGAGATRPCRLSEPGGAAGQRQVDEDLRSLASSQRRREAVQRAGRPQRRMAIEQSRGRCSLSLPLAERVTLQRALELRMRAQTTQRNCPACRAARSVVVPGS